MSLINIRMRIVAMALAGAVSAALVLAVAGGMSPGDAGGPPSDARNSRGEAAVEVAAAPFRIEVIGVRSDGTAVAGAPAVSPGS
jgi:hypothetical protein